MQSRTVSQALAAALLICGLPGAAGAATISGIGTIILPGASTGSFVAGATSSPNNDNLATASPNALTYNVFFNAGGVGNLDVEYVVTNSGGTTEYRVATQGLGLVNNTGQAWTGYRFELGFGLGANFVASGALDGLDFDTPDSDPTPTSSVFTVLNHQADMLDWTGGSAPSIGTVQFTLAIDVPDNLQLINPDGVSRFTLRQTPSVATTAVPVPGTAPLLLAGLLGVARALRGRKGATES